MNLLDGRALILGWLSDQDDDYFTPSLLNVWIKLAQRQVQMELLQAGENWYMKPAETIMVIGQADYVLPSDFMVEHRLEYVLNGSGANEIRQPLDPMTTNGQDRVSIVQGQPAAYYIKKDRVTISPTPDKAYVLRLYYSPMVVDISQDSDVPDVPEQFQEYVYLLAAFNGFIKDDRAPNSLQAKKEEFKTLLKQMAEDRTQDRSRTINETMDYDSVDGAFL